MKKPARNGLPSNDIGDYERFQGSPFRGAPDMSRPKMLFALPGSAAVVRYHLGSEALRVAIEAIGAPGYRFLNDLTPTAAIFGLVRPMSGAPMALLHFDRERGVPRLQFGAVSEKHRPSTDQMLFALKWLDAPPCWLRPGETTAADLGVVYDARAGWIEEQTMSSSRNADRKPFAMAPGGHELRVYHGDARAMIDEFKKEGMFQSSDLAALGENTQIQTQVHLATVGGHAYAALVTTPTSQGERLLVGMHHEIVERKNPRLAMLAFLDALKARPDPDHPNAMRRLRDAFDIKFDASLDRWGLVAPIYMAELRIERECRATSSTLRDSVTIVLPLIEPIRPPAYGEPPRFVADEGSASGKALLERYRLAAMERFMTHPRYAGLRESAPGFGPWACVGAPDVVKLLEDVDFSVDPSFSDEPEIHEDDDRAPAPM